MRMGAVGIMAKDIGLKDASLEYRRQEYDSKNDVLAEFGEWVNAASLYEDIFNDLETIMPIVIIDEDEQKHIIKMSVADAMEQAKGRNDVLMGGVTYYKQFISKKTAKDICAFIIDMDNVYSAYLIETMQDGWKARDGQALPLPTYIVNSGIGLHLYFILKEPIPNYKMQTENIDKLYRQLATIETTKRGFVRKQVQWFGQDFRMAGGCGKDLWENTVFKVGDKWDADELAKACGLDIHFVMPDEPRKQKSSKAAGKRKAAPRRKGFYTNRAFYDYALKQCQNGSSKEGWRYTSMCALSVIAWKCKVPYEELEQDLKALLPIFNTNAERPVKDREVESALKMYNERAIMTPRERLEVWQGWSYKPIKRNGQKRAEHLEESRAIRDIRQKRKGTKWTDGNGRKNKRDIVLQYKQENPNATVTEIAQALGISRPTVYKWLNDKA